MKAGSKGASQPVIFRNPLRSEPGSFINRQPNLRNFTRHPEYRHVQVLLGVASLVKTSHDDLVQPSDLVHVVDIKVLQGDDELAENCH